MTEPPCGTPGANFYQRLSGTGTKSRKDRVRNRYPGRCHICGAPVAAGAGCIDKGSNGKWQVYC